MVQNESRGGEGLITLIDPGVTTLSLTDEQTALLHPISDAVFDIKYFFPTGQVIVKLTNGTGRCEIRGVVTRP